MIAHGALGLVPWPPMHLREALAAGGGTLTDTLHIVWSMVAVLFMMLAIGFGAAAFGKRFRLYSIATMVMLIAFGGLTGTDAPRIDANLPTPWIGVWERINIGVFLLWVVVLAIALLHRTPSPEGRGGQGVRTDETGSRRGQGVRTKGGQGVRTSAQRRRP